MTTTTTWQEDVLERKEEAKKLQAYLTGKYELQKGSKPEVPKRLVTTLRASWGTGKTYLLTNWKQGLIDEGYVCVLYDAWKNDFTRDPLVGIIVALEEQLYSLVHKDKQALVTGQGLLSAVKAIAKIGAAVGGKWVAGETGYAMLAEITEKGIALVEKEYDPIGEHKARLKYMAEFKAALAELVKKIEEWECHKKLPLFIFIDELDRCRPTYAIEVLETVKHLFDVDGVYFVIATDLGELAHSIKAVYGEGFDGAKYLKRFFDMEYLLAEPSKKMFVANLMAHRGLGSILKKVTTPFDRMPNIDQTHNAIATFAAVCDLFRFTLRDIEQIALMLEAVMMSEQFKTTKFSLFPLMFMLCVKHKEPARIQQCLQTKQISLLFEEKFLQSLNSEIRLYDYFDQEPSTKVNDWKTIFVVGVFKHYREHFGVHINDMEARVNPTKSPATTINEWIVYDSFLALEYWNSQNPSLSATHNLFLEYLNHVAELGQFSSM